MIMNVHAARLIESYLLFVVLLQKAKIYTGRACWIGRREENCTYAFEYCKLSYERYYGSKYIGKGSRYEAFFFRFVKSKIQAS